MINLVLLIAMLVVAVAELNDAVIVAAIHQWYWCRRLWACVKAQTALLRFVADLLFVVQQIHNSLILPFI